MGEIIASASACRLSIAKLLRMQLPDYVSYECCRLKDAQMFCSTLNCQYGFIVLPAPRPTIQLQYTYPHSHSQTRNAHKLKQTQRFMLSQELQEFAEHLRPKGNVSSLSEGRLRTRGYVSTARGPITTTYTHTRSRVTCSLPLARHKTWHSMMPMGKFRTLRRQTSRRRSTQYVCMQSLAWPKHHFTTAKPAHPVSVSCARRRLLALPCCLSC